MGQYELIFVVDKLGDSTIASIYEDHDALYAEHGSVNLLTITQVGRTALDAAKRIVTALEVRSGVIFQRAYQDFVSRSDIAERTDSTVQAVGQWVRGERYKDTPFPEPYNLVSGGIWLWGEVNEWLRRVHKEHDPIHYPCRTDIDDINRWLTERRVETPLSGMRESHHSHFGGLSLLLAAWPGQSHRDFRAHLQRTWLTADQQTSEWLQAGYVHEETSG